MTGRARLCSLNCRVCSRPSPSRTSTVNGRCWKRQSERSSGKPPTAPARTRRRLSPSRVRSSEPRRPRLRKRLPRDRAPRPRSAPTCRRGRNRRNDPRDRCEPSRRGFPRDWAAPILRNDQDERVVPSRCRARRCEEQRRPRVDPCRGRQLCQPRSSPHPRHLRRNVQSRRKMEQELAARARIVPSSRAGALAAASRCRTRV
jgi:hypothetical protein